MGLLLGGHLHSAPGPAPVVTLSGTSGSPNVSFDAEDTPVNALAGWRFNPNGSVERIHLDAWTVWNAGVEWVDLSGGNYWIKATLDAGDAPTTGPTLGVWHQIDITNEWSWIESSDPPAFAKTEGTLHIEISDESDGTPVLDDGYYEGSANQFGTA